MARSWVTWLLGGWRLEAKRFHRRLVAQGSRLFAVELGQDQLETRLEQLKAEVRSIPRPNLVEVPGKREMDAAMEKLEADMDASEAEMLKLPPEERARRWAETLEAWAPETSGESFFGIEKPAKLLEGVRVGHAMNGPCHCGVEHAMVDGRVTS